MKRYQQLALLSLLFVDLTASGCVGSSSPTNVGAAHAPASAMLAPAPTDMILQLAATAPVGAAEPVTDPATGAAVTFHAIRRYTSAAGNPCAEYRVTTEETIIRQGLACEIGGTWQDVRPLLAGAAVAAIP